MNPDCQTLNPYSSCKTTISHAQIGQKYIKKSVKEWKKLTFSESEVELLLLINIIVIAPSSLGTLLEPILCYNHYNGQQLTLTTAYLFLLILSIMLTQMNQIRVSKKVSGKQH